MFEQFCPLCNVKTFIDIENDQAPVNHTNILHECAHCGFDKALRIVARGGDQYEAIVRAKGAKLHRTQFVKNPSSDKQDGKYMRVSRECANKECREGAYGKRLLKMVVNVERGISICKLCGTTAMLQ